MLKVSYDLDNVAKTAGVLYVLELDVDGKTVVKIGLTHRKVEERVCEILTSYWKSYRVFPRCYPKRFRKVEDVYAKEQELLRYFSDRKYESEKRFSGCQELVDVAVDEVVQKYEELVSGVNIWNTAGESGKGGDEGTIEGVEGGVQEGG